MLLPDWILGECADDRLCQIGIAAIEVLVIGSAALLFLPARNRREGGRREPSVSHALYKGRRARDRFARWSVVVLSLAFWIAVGMWWWFRG